MSAARVTVQMTYWMEEVEADGSKCHACGDACYLKMFGIFISAPKLVERLQLPVVFCESCRQLVEDGMREFNA